MSEALGEEFIRIRPDLSGFQAEVQAQVTAALSNVRQQVGAAQAQAAAATTAAARVAAPAPVVQAGAQAAAAQAQTQAQRQIVIARSVEAAQREAARAGAQAQVAAQAEVGAAAGATAKEQLKATDAVLRAQQKIAAEVQSSMAIQTEATRASAAVQIEMQHQIAAAVRATAAAQREANTAAARALTQQQATAQKQATQARIGAAAAQAQAPVTSPGGVVLPPGATRQAQIVANAAAAAQETTAASTQRATAATKLNAQAQKVLGTTSRATTTQVKDMNRAVQDTERSLGRSTRGLVAATAASSGFFRAVSFASGAFLVGAALGAVIHAATQEFSDMTRVGAQTVAILEATGNAANVTAAQIDALASAQLNLTGIDDELVKGAANVILTFRNIKNEGEGLNAVFDRAVVATEDISAVLGTNMRSTAIQVGKALQDPIRGVTALRRSGISLSQSQRELIKRFVETGQIMRAQKLILREIEQQVGGTARAIGQTLPGKLNILKERASNALGDYVKRLNESEQASRIAAAGAQALGQVWGVLQGTLRALGPPLLQVAEGLLKATQAVGGVGTILAAVAAYKSVMLVVKAATVLQVAYTRAVLVGTGAVTAQNAALLAQAGLLKGVSAAQLAGTTAQVGNTAVQIGALGARTGAAAAGMGALRIGLSALGGPVGAVGIAVGALAVGALILGRRVENAAGSLNAFKRAVEGLDASLKAGQAGRDAYAAQIETINEAAMDARDAARDVAAAQKALAASRSLPGSLERVALEDKLRAAQERVRLTTEALRGARIKLTTIEAQADQRQSQRASLIHNTTQEVLANIDAMKRHQRIVTTEILGQTIPIGIRFATGTKSPQAAVKDFQTMMKELGKTGGQATRQATESLLVLSTVLSRLPTDQEVKIAFSAAGQGRTAEFILDQLGVVRQIADLEQQRADNAFALANITGRENALLQEQRNALLGTLKLEKEKRAEILETVKARREDLEQAKEQVNLAREALAAARDALADARQALADTLVTAREAVNQAVDDAKRNLFSIADAVAEALARIADEGGGKVSAALSKRFEELRDQIIRGGGGPETQRAAQEVAAIGQAQQARGGDDDIAEKIRKRLGDLAFSLNAGLVGPKEFNKRFQGILREFKFDPVEFRKRFGTKAAAEITSLIGGLRTQAGLIVGGPQRPGTGVAPELVDPMDAVAQANRDIADAQSNIADAQKNVGRAIKDLNDALKERDEAQKAFQKENNRLTRINNQINRNTNTLLRTRLPKPNTKPKPTGQSGREAGAVTKATIRGGD